MSTTLSKHVSDSTHIIFFQYVKTAKILSGHYRAASELDKHRNFSILARKQCIVHFLDYFFLKTTILSYTTNIAKISSYLVELNPVQ